MRWTGSIKTRYTGTYTFTTVADDGVRVIVNGQPVINNDWIAQSATTASGTIQLTGGQTYSVEVDYFEDGNGPSQIAFSAQFPLPPAPIGLTANFTTGRVNLSWQPVTGATSYQVYRAGTDGIFSYAVYATPSTNGTDTNIQPGMTYQYEVFSYGPDINGNNGYGPPSNPISITIPAPPTGLTATPGNGSVGLKWNTVTGATGYNLKRSTTSNGPYTTISAATQATNYNDTGLTNATTYYYVVSTIVGPGAESANSPQVSATPAATDDAQFVSINVPSTMIAGQTYSVQVQMKNVGSNTWVSGDTGYELVTQQPFGNSLWNPQPGASSDNNAVSLLATVPPGSSQTASVAPGVTATFTFNVTAPTTPRLYAFQWQMYHRYQPATFGQATPPNQTVNVVSDNAAFLGQSPVPPVVRAGFTYPVWIQMQNTGSSTWVDGDAGYELVTQQPLGNSLWSPMPGASSDNNAVSLLATVPSGQSDSVAPGASPTFNFFVTTPSQPGSYTFQWQMYHRYQSAPFGTATTPQTWTNPADDAIVVGTPTPPPATMRAGQTYPVSVTMRNIGTATWTTGPVTPNGNTGYMLLSLNQPNNAIWNPSPGVSNPDNSVSIAATVPPGSGQPASVGPGQTATFNFTVTAPSAPGTYNFQWQMMHNFVDIFGDQTPPVSCTVLPDDAKFISQKTPPAIMQPGQTYPVQVVMQNVGGSTWTTGPLQPTTQPTGYMLVAQNILGNSTWNPNPGITNPNNSVNISATVPPGSGQPASVAPGQFAYFNFSVTAPTKPGPYDFQWQMMRNFYYVFGDQTTDVVCTVPGFTLATDTPNPNLSLSNGGSSDGGPAEMMLTATPIGGFTGTVSLTLSYLDPSGTPVDGAPGGMYYWFNPATDADPATGTVTISDTNSQSTLLSICSCEGNPTPGTYTIIVTATAGTITTTTPMALTITN